MLKDSFNRNHDYLRVSLTDKCNLKCIYCIPSAGVKLLSHDEILRNEEFLRILAILHGMGINKIRFTGGEPLVRRGIDDIIRRTAQSLPDAELCLTTNGVLLDNYFDVLHDSGLKKINISLDTVSPEIYKRISGMDFFQRVIDNIEKALDYGFFKIKINAVLLSSTLNELEGFIDFFKTKDVVLRFIEIMPFTGQYSEFIPAQNLIMKLQNLGELVRNRISDTSVAMMYDLHHKSGNTIKIGIIPPISHKFCNNCNRLRLTSDGRLKTCLYSGVSRDVRKLLRANLSDEEIMSVITELMSQKISEHSFSCCSTEPHGCSAIVGERIMSRIGG